jgi:SAM-dependent methyltransferase
LVSNREFDRIAEHYDATRGGESRGDEYASEIDPLLGQTVAPVLEIGIGTGVVALGLARRGRRVVGIDVSSPMLARAILRVGNVVAKSDATKMAIASSSLDRAVSVWVIQAVDDPPALFLEVARVLRQGGRFVVCTGQSATRGDRVGQIIRQMALDVDERRGALRPRGVSVEEVINWARPAGFGATVRTFERTWQSTKEEELYAIEHRVWPALRELNDHDAEEVTTPIVEELKAMSEEIFARRAIASMVVLDLL